MGRQLPRSVTRAVQTQAALVVVSGLITVLTAIQREELEAAFVARESPDIDVPAFVPVAVVLWATFALLAAVLVVFFRSGHPSARLSLTGLAAFFLFTMVVMVQQDPPGLFVVMAVVAGVLDVVLVYFLWHRETSAFMRGAQLADDLES
jgi:hypothetical protein